MKNNIKWLIQYSSVSDTHLQSVVEQVKFSGAQHDFFGVIPFCNDITGLENALEKDFYYIFHSSVKVLDIFEHCTSILDLNNDLLPWQKEMAGELLKRLKLGIFHDKKAFDQSFYGTMNLPLLNNDSEIKLCRDVLHQFYDEDLFIKPSSDTKAFDAGIIEAGKTIKEHIESQFHREDYKNELILLSPLKEIDAEYRFFVVNNEVVSGSSYRINGQLKSSPNVPKNVWEKAVEYSKLYQPHDVFTLDLCEVGNDIKIVEYNCFNCSGIYATEYEKVINKVEHFFNEKIIGDVK